MYLTETRWTCCLCTVGQVVRTLPEGKEVCGVTSLDNEIFLLRTKGRDQVEVYDAITYSLQRYLTVPNSRGFTDMTSCEHYRCLYIGDHIAVYIHCESKKLCHFYFYCNFGKCWSIFKILSMSESERNGS